METENENQQEGPAPADLSPLTDDMTLGTIRARITLAETEFAALTADDGDRSLAASRRVTALRDFIVAGYEMIAEIEGTDTAAPAAPAPTPPPPVEAPQAPVVEDPAPVVEQPTPDPEPTPDPVAEPTVAPPAPSAADMDDETLAKAMEDLTAEMASRGGAAGEGEGATDQPDPVDDRELVGGAPILATAGQGQFEHARVQGDTTLAAVGQQMLALNRMAHLIPGDGPLRKNLFRRDLLADHPDVPRLNDDPEWNTRLLFNRSELEEPVAAAADLSICGDPTEVAIRGCTLDSSTPFLDALAGNTVAATNCIVRWRQPLSVDTISPGPQLWTSCDQENVDPADRATWKPLSSNQLPPCDDYCTAQPFDTIMGLGITLNDQMCRPERIDEMNRWIEVFHAILLEQTAMSMFDLQVGPDHHFKFDASALDPGNPNFTAVGAYPAFIYAVHMITMRMGIDRHNTIEEGWWMSVHPTLISTLSMDMALAGENGNVVQRLTEDLAATGIRGVVVQKDYGVCEGLLAAPLAGNGVLCDIENCDIPTYNDPGTGCVAFGAGVDLPGAVTDFRVRFFQRDSWYHGTTALVDYALHTSAELMRQNRAEYFGERRDLLFRGASCGAVDFSLDLSNLCASGQRIMPHAALPCPLPVGGDGTPPPLVGISPAGQPTPITLPNQADPDPATTPPDPSNIQGSNPDPGLPPGTPQPGFTPAP